MLEGMDVFSLMLYSANIKSNEIGCIYRAQNTGSALNLGMSLRSHHLFQYSGAGNMSSLSCHFKSVTTIFLVKHYSIIVKKKIIIIKMPNIWRSIVG